MRGLVLGTLIAIFIVAGQPVSATVPASCDSVTGGGFIIGDGTSDLAQGARATFGVGGGAKNGTFWGHLEYNDHSASPPHQVHGTSVTGYTVAGNSRIITGTADVNGSAGFTYTVIVIDGDPVGDADSFSIHIDQTGYTAAGVLVGGNIQLHKPNPSTTTCPQPQ